MEGVLFLSLLTVLQRDAHSEASANECCYINNCSKNPTGFSQCDHLLSDSFMINGDDVFWMLSLKLLQMLLSALLLTAFDS